jgi:FNIP Repeat
MMMDENEIENRKPTTLTLATVISPVVSLLLLCLTDHEVFNVFGLTNVEFKRFTAHYAIKKNIDFDSIFPYPDFDFPTHLLNQMTHLSVRLSSLHHLFSLFRKNDPTYKTGCALKTLCVTGIASNDSSFLLSLFEEKLDMSLLPSNLRHLDLSEMLLNNAELLISSFSFLWNADQSSFASVIRFDFPFNFNRDIDTTFPFSQLEYITLYGNFNSKISKNVLPCTLKRLIFGSDYNQIIEEGVLPEALEILQFGYRYNHLFPVLPKSLIKLSLGEQFNQFIGEHILPTSLQVLILPGRWNHIISKITLCLPPHLEELEFGRKYNEIIPENMLPNSLKILKFGYEYNQELPTPLPSSLETLHFHFRFNQKFAIPSTLRVLILHQSFNLALKEFPNSLEEIYLHQDFLLSYLPKDIPSSCKILAFCPCIDNYDKQLVINTGKIVVLGSEDMRDKYPFCPTRLPFTKTMLCCVSSEVYCSHFERVRRGRLYIYFVPCETEKENVQIHL